MANHNPLSTATSAAGGAVVRPEVAETLLEGVFRSSGVLQQLQAAGSVRRTNSKQTVFPLYKGRPVAYVVDEAAAITTTGAELSDVTITAKKFATITSVTSEMLEDQNTGTELMSLISADVDAAIGDLIEQHILGLTAGANLTSALDFNIRTGVTTNSVTLGGTGDRLRVATSAAIQKIRKAGYSPNGVTFCTDGEAELRDARATVETTNPVYTDANSAFYGLNATTSNHLNDIAGSSKIVGVVADWKQAQMVLRNDLRLTVSNDATIGGVENFTKDMQSYRWTLRAGLGSAFERAFCVIKTAA